MRSLVSRKFLVVLAGIAAVVFGKLDTNSMLAVAGMVSAYLGANVTQKVKV
jgi:hypothetical protein